MNLIAHLLSWPIVVMVAINLSRTVVDTQVAKYVRLALLLLLLVVVWHAQQT